MKRLLFILLLLPVFSEGQIDILHNQLTITSTSKIADISIDRPLGKTVYTQSYDTLHSDTRWLVSDGLMIHTIIYKITQLTIDVSTLDKGTYFVKVNGVEMGKFVKHKSRHLRE